MSKTGSKRRKRVLTGILAAGALLGGGAWYQRHTVLTREARIREANKDILTAESTRDSIVSTVVGNGTLRDGELEDILVPVGLTVDTVLVKSGDLVSAGQVLATLNAKSIEKALKKEQTKLDELDAQLSDLESEEGDRILTSPVSGRIKTIYANGGESASAVLREHGSLLTISSDGLMALDLSPSEELSQGQRVLVEGSQSAYGTVELIRGGTASITVNDQYFREGESVTVYTQSRSSRLGTARIYIHQPLLVTADSGRVSRLYVRENSSVKAGDDLLLLEDAGSTGRKEELLESRREILASVNLLKEYQESGALLAKTSGIIHDVYLKDGEEITAASAALGQGSEGLDLSSFSSLMGTSALLEEPGTIELLSWEEGIWEEEPWDEEWDSGEIWDSQGFEDSLVMENDSPLTAEDLEALLEEGLPLSPSQNAVGITVLPAEEAVPDTYLDGTIALPVDVPMAGNAPMGKDELALLVSQALSLEGKDSLYHVEDLAWTSGEVFMENEVALAFVSIKSDISRRIFFYPDAQRIRISAPEGAESAFLLEDQDQDGRYETLLAALSFPVLPRQSVSSPLPLPEEPLLEEPIPEETFPEKPYQEDPFPEENWVPEDWDRPEPEEDTLEWELNGLTEEDGEELPLLEEDLPIPDSLEEEDWEVPEEDITEEWTEEEDLPVELGLLDTLRQAQERLNARLTPSPLPSQTPVPEETLSPTPAGEATLSPTPAGKETPSPTPSGTPEGEVSPTPAAPTVTQAPVEELSPTPLPALSPTGSLWPSWPAITGFPWIRISLTPSPSRTPSVTPALTPTPAAQSPGVSQYLGLLSSLLRSSRSGSLDLSQLVGRLFSSLGTQEGEDDGFTSEVDPEENIRNVPSLWSILAGGGSSGLSNLLSGTGSGLSSLLGSSSSGSGLSSLLSSLGGSSGLSSLLGGSSGLSSLLGGSSGLSSLLGGSSPGSNGLSSLLSSLGGSSSGLSSLLGGSSAGLSSLLGGTGSGSLSSLGSALDLAALANSLGAGSSLSAGTLSSPLSSSDLSSLARGLTGSSSLSGSSLLGSSLSSVPSTSYQETAGFTLANSELMDVVIQVNELDILEIENGQMAEVKLEALEDVAFAGIVTKIGEASTQGTGSVTKYPVTITLLRDERMRPGMNATASVTVDEKEGVFTLPADAIQESLGRTFVYTQKSEEGELGGEVYVTCGISDDTKVEILEGIPEGQRVYYRSIIPTSLYPFAARSGQQEDS